MSLYLSALEDFTILDKSTQPDGMGGVITTWSEGAKIKAAVVLNDSSMAAIAQALGTKDTYKITTPKSVCLWPQDVIRRDSDGTTFRITSNGTDNKTPATAGLDMRVVKAEAWKLNE